MVKVRVPSDIRGTGYPGIIEVKAVNLGQMINELDKIIPGLKKELCNESGIILSSTFDYFVNGESTHPSVSSTPLKDGDEVIIVPLDVDVGG
jgi:molybdopterin converting factor small subunit